MKAIAFMVAWAMMGYTLVQGGYLNKPNAILMIVSVLGMFVAQSGYPVISISIMLFCVFLEVIMKRIKMAKFKYAEEFESIYQKQKELFGKEYEKNQKSLQTYIITFFALIVGFMCLSVILQNFDKMSPDWKIGIKYVMFIVVFVIQGICTLKIEKIQLRNREIYEKYLLPILVSDIDKNLKYSRTLTTTNWYIRQRYDDSGLEEKNTKHLVARIFCHGQLDGTISFEMVEMHVINVVRRYGRGIGTSNIPVFDGLFVISQISKNVCEELKISPHKFNFFRNYNKTVLDIGEFEKRFDVHSSNQAMAMRILSPDTMEAITSFYNKYKINFEVLIKGNNLYLRLFTGNLFGYEKSESMLNKKELFLYYSTVKFVVNLTKKINNVVNEIEI